MNRQVFSNTLSVYMHANVWKNYIDDRMQSKGSDRRSKVN